MRMQELSMTCRWRVLGACCALYVFGCAADDTVGTGLDSGVHMQPDQDATTTGAADAASSDDDSGTQVGVGDASSADSATPIDPGAICTSCGGCDQALATESASHVVGEVDYADKPPASGNHNDCWGPWGVHDTALRPERWVHNLEHGGVVFLYRCQGSCPSDVAELAKLVTGKPQALLTRYDDMPTTYAIVAWGHRIKSTCFDEQAFAAFYAEHVDHGPESITNDPPGGCPP